MEYQLRLLINNEEIADYFNPEHEKFIKPNEINDILKDVQDCVLHKKVIEPNSNTLSYTISTDGAPAFNMYQYVLLVGMMIVKTEPKPELMNLYISEFWKQTSHLYTQGFKIRFQNEAREKTLYFAPILVVILRLGLCYRIDYNIMNTSAA